MLIADDWLERVRAAAQHYTTVAAGRFHLGRA